MTSFCYNVNKMVNANMIICLSTPLKRTNINILYLVCLIHAQAVCKNINKFMVLAGNIYMAELLCDKQEVICSVHGLLDSVKAYMFL